MTGAQRLIAERLREAGIPTEELDVETLELLACAFAIGYADGLSVREHAA